MDERFIRKIDSRIEQLNNLKKRGDIFNALETIANSLKKGKKLLVFGNGGSATQASHFAAELVNKFYFERIAVPAIALAADTAILTAIANDTDFKYVFSRQIEAIGQEGDVALGITTSGRSQNVLEALKKAKKMNLITIALCGRNIELLKTLHLDTIIPVDSDDTPTIQEMHLFILHTMAEALEEKSTAW